MSGPLDPFWVQMIDPVQASLTIKILLWSKIQFGNRNLEGLQCRNQDLHRLWYLADWRNWRNCHSKFSFQLFSLKYFSELFALIPHPYKISPTKKLTSTTAFMFLSFLYNLFCDVHSFFPFDLASFTWNYFRSFITKWIIFIDFVLKFISFCQNFIFKIIILTKFKL